MDTQYKLGAKKDHDDLRNIPLVAVQAPLPKGSIPSKYMTDVSMIPILNQNQIGACVGHAKATVLCYLNWKETGNIIYLSPRFLYALAKAIDNNPNEGTYPAIVAKIAKDMGCPTTKTVPNDTLLSHKDYINITVTDAIKEDAYPFRTGGYATVNGGIADALKNAIVQNGVIDVTISVGNYTSPMRKGTDGLHRIVLYGFDGDTFYFINSWGESWGDKGKGYFYFKQQEVTDALATVDIPNEILKKVQSLPTAVLTRQPSTKTETLGEMVATYNGLSKTFKTLERPDLGNKPNISCIPKGKYVCKRIFSLKFLGYVYQLQNVTGRSGIYIHAGNYYRDVQGCIILGSAFSDIDRDGNLDVINSKISCKALFDFFNNQSFTLIIK